MMMCSTYKENYVEDVKNIFDEFDTATICISGLVMIAGPRCTRLQTVGVLL